MSLSCLVLAPALFLSTARPQEPDAAPRPRLEIVFTLDTTGSMGGLLEGAKKRIWSIVNEFTRSKPMPHLRVGLVAYRDRGDAYVTQLTDLTDDLDSVFQALVALQAQGGGDGPEDVNRALAEAVARPSWSADPRVVRSIFLVGDAPPHMDYAGETQYPGTCETAAREGIAIHTLQCGGASETQEIWREIARRAEGTYAAIPADGGAPALPTPFDDRLAELGRRLSGTMLVYGDREARDDTARRLESTAKAAETVAPSAAADRAVLGARLGFVAGGDLLDRLGEGEMKLEDLDEKNLPDDLRAIPAAERGAFLEKRRAERDALRKEIGSVETERAKFLEAEAAKHGPGKDGFAEAVLRAVREQAAKKGVTLP